MPVAREYPSLPIIGIAGIVIANGHVLLVRRGTPPLQGEWSVPGGRLELGERISEGVQRELAEETGVDVKVGELVEVFESVTFDNAGGLRYHFVVLDYLCEMIRGEAHAGSDAAEIAWVSEADLVRFSIREATAAILKKAFRAYRRGEK